MWGQVNGRLKATGGLLGTTFASTMVALFFLFFYLLFLPSKLLSEDRLVVSNVFENHYIVSLLSP